MATVTIEYYGVEGTGKNLTEAKRDAGRKIEAALSGSYTPEIVAYRGCAVLVYREPSGWNTRTITSDSREILAGTVWGSLANSKEDAMRSAKRHVAQLGWQPADGDAVPEFLTDRSDIAEFRSWVRFQLRYAKARAAGLSSTDAHNYAGHNPACPAEFFAKVDGGNVAPGAA